MTYIRHRSRMVQQSVIQDLKDTLIACRWMPGTTSRPVWDPQEPRIFDPSTGQYTAPPRKIITVTEAEVLPLLRGQSISVIDYFPEAEGDRSRSSKTPPNTFAVDYGQPSDPEPAELGSSREEQEYIFNFAFYSASDAVALAMFSDLRDRYSGRIVEMAARLGRRPLCGRRQHGRRQLPVRAQRGHLARPPRGPPLLRRARHHRLHRPVTKTEPLAARSLR